MKAMQVSVLVVQANMLHRDKADPVGRKVQKCEDVRLTRYAGEEANVRIADVRTAEVRKPCIGLIRLLHEILMLS